MVRGRTPVSLDLPMPAALADGAAASKQDLAYGALRDAILTGVLAAGVRMPSTRTLALRWQLSRGTVETVYDRLCLEGYLARRQGAGTFIAAAIPDAYLSILTPRPRRSEEAGGSQPATIQHGGSWVSIGRPFVARFPDPALFSWHHWSRLMAKAASPSRTALQGQSDPTGLPALRTQISDYLRKFRNIDCAPDDILMTTGTRHALDLIGRCYLSAGDTVCIEDPCYPFAHQIFALTGASIAHVPVRADGMDTAALPADGDVRLVYVTPAHQSPLGIAMPVNRRLELLEWAMSHDAVIVEDDYDSEFSYGGAPLPALMSIDQSGRTIYCGSFNKTLCPDMRIGFIVAKGQARQKLAGMWNLVGRSVSIAEQITLESYLRTGAFARHLRVARHAYAQRRDRLLKILDERADGRFSVSGHEAGFHFVLWLKNGQSEADICEKAANFGITLQPLSALCCHTQLPAAVIIGYTALTPDQIEEAGRTLGGILAEG